MKLLRVGEHGKEIPAIIDNQNNFRNLSNILKDFTPENLNFENLDKIKKAYPDWEISKSLNDIFLDVYNEVFRNLGL